MHTITISLPDKQFSALQDVADRLKVTPEDLARAGVEGLLAQPDDRFRAMLDHLMIKNAELYRRLASV